MALRIFVGFVSIIFLATLAEDASAGVFYTDRTMFEQVAGNLWEEDFDSFPADGNGFSAFSNGQFFRAFSLTSLTFDMDVDSLDAPLNDTGLDGTFLVDEANLGNNQIRPGGQGLANTDADDDDFRINFASPVAAVGLLILDNRIDVADQPESIAFIDKASNPIATTTLPGSTLGSGGAGFIGLVQEPGEMQISFVEVNEGRVLNDDLLFDDLLFDDILYSNPIPEPASVSLVFVTLLGGLGCCRWRRNDDKTNNSLQCRCELHSTTSACLNYP